MNFEEYKPLKEKRMYELISDPKKRRDRYSSAETENKTLKLCYFYKWR